MNTTSKGSFMAGGYRRQQGLSLIELMIAMLLGLLVVGSAGAVFLSNKRVYGSSETLGRIQENQRAAFELMSRDLREAGGNPCSSSATVVNQLNGGTSVWWTSFSSGLQGYGGSDTAPGTAMTASGGGAGQRVQGTDAVDIHLANDGDIRVIQHDTPSAVLQVSSTEGVAVGDVLMVCNMDYAFIFEVSGLTSTGGAGIQHNGGASSTIGNCSQEFQWQQPCLSGGASGAYGYCMMVPDLTSVNPSCNKFSDAPAAVAKVATSRWYIGFNGRGGRSLYRAAVVNSTTSATPNLVTPEEIAEGVTSMTITYLSAGAAAYQAAADVTDWSQVTAVRLQMTFAGTEGALRGGYIRGTNNQILSRNVSNIVALRNREGLL